MESAAPDIQFFHEMVEPTVDEFVVGKSNLRRGLLACLMIAAMTEHYFHAHPEIDGDKGKFKGAVRDWKNGGNFAVGLIADVANGTKHVVSDRGRIGYNDTQVHNTGAIGTLRIGWPKGDNEEVLVDENRDWRLSQLIESAMDFWRQKLGPELEAGNAAP